MLTAGPGRGISNLANFRVTWSKGQTTVQQVLDELLPGYGLEWVGRRWELGQTLLLLVSGVDHECVARLMEVVHRVQTFFELRKHLPDGLLAVLFEI